MGAVGGLDLGEHVGHVVAHRLRAEHEAAGDRVVVEALGDELEDVELALGELRERPAGRRDRRAWASSVTAVGERRGRARRRRRRPARRACSTRSGPAPLTRYPLAPSRSAVSAVSWSSDIVSMTTRTSGWCSASQRLTSRPEPSARRTSSSTHVRRGVGSTSAGHLVGALGLADELDAVHLLDRRGQAHAEHRVVVDDGDAHAERRRHGSAAGSWTWTRVPRGALRQRRRTVPPSSAARSRIAVEPDAGGARRRRCRRRRRRRRSRPSAPVAMRQPAARRAGVADDVGHGLGDDAVRRHLDGGRQLDRLRRQGEVDLEVVVERRG